MRELRLLLMMFSMLVRAVWPAIPSERQIVPPELSRVQSVTLVVDADAAAPEVIGIAAVGGAALQIDPIEEGAGDDLPVFLEFGAALRGQRGEPVVRRARPTEPA